MGPSRRRGAPWQERRPPATTTTLAAATRPTHRPRTAATLQSRSAQRRWHPRRDDLSRHRDVPTEEWGPTAASSRGRPRHPTPRRWEQRRRRPAEPPSNDAPSPAPGHLREPAGRPHAAPKRSTYDSTRPSIALTEARSAAPARGWSARA